MFKVKDIAKQSMTEEKKASAKRDIFAFYIGRPLSYLLTVPFLYLGASPNLVSLISLIPVILGIVITMFSNTISIMYFSWICFFVWNLLDGVDGNIARFTGKTSRLGSVYDAMSGYAATAAIFLVWGIAASFYPGIISKILHVDCDLYVIMGALSSIFTLYPRLVMQKTIAVVGKGGSDDIKAGSLLKDIVFNITSVSGFIQVIMLASIPLKCFDLFTLIYFVINIGLMFVTIKSCLCNAKEN